MTMCTHVYVHACVYIFPLPGWVADSHHLHRVSLGVEQEPGLGAAGTQILLWGTAWVDVVFVPQALQSSRANMPLFPLPVARLGPDSE